MKKPIAVLMTLALVATGLFLAWGSLTGIAARPGFFGTRATLFSDLNLIAQILLLLGLSVGVYFAHQGNIPVHQYIQTGMVLLNLVLTVFIMITAYTAYIVPGIPGNLSTADGLVATIHSVIGLGAIGCGVYLLLHMNRLVPARWRVRWWRNLMRLTIVLYWFVGVLGVAVYYVWYMR